MRKKDLLSQNASLFDKLQKSIVQNRELKKEIDIKNSIVVQMQKRLDELSKKVDALSANQNSFVLQEKAVLSAEEQTEDFTNEDAVVQTVALSSEIEYGAKIIGKIVVESAKATEKIGDNSELRNLIMFKTESIKAEILSICNSDVSLDDKKRMIDFQLEEAIDYYRSIIAQ